MERALTAYDTGIAKKALVAITGLVLFGFVIVHMLGNLQVFEGAEALNGYSRKLHALPGLLWGARLVLLVSAVVHVVLSLELVKKARAARRVGYRQRQSLATSYAARTMKYSGPLLLAFIVYHLSHFTWPGVAMGAYQHDPDNVYANVIHAFQVPWVTAVYVTAQLLLGLHLYHGGVSLFQSLGLNHPRYERLRHALPRAFALLVVAGNVLMPLCVLLGVIS